MPPRGEARSEAKRPNPEWGLSGGQTASGFGLSDGRVVRGGVGRIPSQHNKPFLYDTKLYVRHIHKRTENKTLILHPPQYMNMSANDKVTLIREGPITTTIPVYTATATFIDGETKTYTYHKKETQNGTIILYDYDTEDTKARPTPFENHPIEDETGTYYEKVPFKPAVKLGTQHEQKIISLETCKDFTIEGTTQETLTHNNWGAEVDMPRDAALAYQRHFGKDNTRIRD